MHTIIWVLGVEYAIGFLFTLGRLVLQGDFTGHRMNTPPGRKRRWSDTRWGAPIACLIGAALWFVVAAEILWKEMR